MVLIVPKGGIKEKDLEGWICKGGHGRDEDEDGAEDDEGGEEDDEEDVFDVVERGGNKEE
jgi:hypothetical protein